MTGGGSGGHITPILAVAHELKRHDSSAEVVYIGQRGDNFADIVEEHHDVIDAVYSVRAGKFRRYHGEGWRQLLDIHTLWLNIRDVLFVIIGFWQSFWLLGKVKPDVIFVKGGFVGVPVGLAAALRRIPYVTHDSDAIPGLANRIIARWAHTHAVALPIELYPYPPAKTVDVGVPVSHNYVPVDDLKRANYRHEAGISQYKHILLVTGGGLGAERVNKALLSVASDLLVADPTLCIVHTVGHKHEKAVSAAYTRLLAPDDRRRVIVRDYINDLYRYSGAADLVVARGGATNLAELAGQGAAVIVVPNPLLTGGHQLKNALAYAEKQAIVVVTEESLQKTPQILGAKIGELLKDQAQRAALSKNIATFSRANAAEKLAELLLNTKKDSTNASQSPKKA